MSKSCGLELESVEFLPPKRIVLPESGHFRNPASKTQSPRSGLERLTSLCPHLESARYPATTMLSRSAELCEIPKASVYSAIESCFCSAIVLLQAWRARLIVLGSSRTRSWSSSPRACSRRTHQRTTSWWTAERWGSRCASRHWRIGRRSRAVRLPKRKILLQSRFVGYRSRLWGLRTFPLDLEMARMWFYHFAGGLRKRGEFAASFAGGLRQRGGGPHARHSGETGATSARAARGGSERLEEKGSFFGSVLDAKNAAAKGEG